MFDDRKQAGLRLAEELAGAELADPVVLALPRGGVPVAAEIAARLGAPLDIVIVRKVGVPGNPELAVAAIVEGDPPHVVVNRDIAAECGIDEARLEALIAAEQPELARRGNVYRTGHPAVAVGGRTAILVDDGAATGATMKVAVRALRQRRPRQIVVALPVAPSETVAELARQADRVVCLHRPASFLALGQYYRDFGQLGDAEVVETLRTARQRHRDVPDDRPGG